jgi:hypothetical protein
MEICPHLKTETDLVSEMLYQSQDSTVSIVTVYVPDV